MKRVSSVPQNMNMDSDVTKSRALNPFEDLPQGDKVFAQYVWLGGSWKFANKKSEIYDQI